MADRDLRQRVCASCSHFRTDLTKNTPRIGPPAIELQAVARATADAGECRARSPVPFNGAEVIRLAVQTLMGKGSSIDIAAVTNEALLGVQATAWPIVPAGANCGEYDGAQLVINAQIKSRVN